MKEAAGEANMTVITIVLIGLVAAAGAVLIPNLLTNTSDQTDCAAAGKIWYNGTCYSPSKCSQSGGKYVCK